MSEINVRADAVNVEQLMEQIRARIREKRGVDYTEQQIQELAKVKLEKFLDPSAIRSDLLERQHMSPSGEPVGLPNYTFESTTLFESRRGPVRLIRFVRRMLNPVLKLFFNPNPLIQALNIQSRLNTIHATREALTYEVIHNLVLEMTRMSIETKSLKMRIESLTSRLEFNERRARALESVVVYKPTATSGDERAVPASPEPAAVSDEAVTTAPPTSPASGSTQEGPGQRSRRRRRRRGRRGGGSATALMGGAASQDSAASDASDNADADSLMDGDADVDQRDPADHGDTNTPDSES
ncbi:MAG: hypothetical protein LBQ09_06880 [Acidobacteriaceae bacterium]|jgi:hypothetical protein|nr:hypothetical protein [Acidobacteriaceae bacterium]